MTIRFWTVQQFLKAFYTRRRLSQDLTSYVELRKKIFPIILDINNANGAHLIKEKLRRSTYFGISVAVKRCKDKKILYRFRKKEPPLIPFVTINLCLK